MFCCFLIIMMKIIDHYYICVIKIDKCIYLSILL